MAYAETTELARILNIRTPTDAQSAALERKLDVATGEIDAEIDLDVDTVLSPEQQATLEDVCLRRAAELWLLDDRSLGVVTTELGAVYLAKDSWKKYSIELAHIKDRFGFA